MPLVAMLAVDVMLLDPTDETAETPAASAPEVVIP
jgi:hypothetical protein